MALKCEICGGGLEMQSEGSAICSGCGMNYPIERLRALLNDQGITHNISEQSVLNPELQYMDIRDNVLVKYTGRAKHLKIPNGVTEISGDAFYPEAVRDRLESVEIPGSVHSLGTALRYSQNLKKVTLCSGVETIGDEAFYCCRLLENVVIPNSVTKVGKEAFSCCGNLATVEIGNNVTSIENEAFSCCGSLIEVTIPDSVTSIGREIFYGCGNLKTVKIGKKVTSIPFKAFSNCSNLECLELGNGIESIECFAFEKCTNLKSLTIPDSVTSIDKYAFVGCYWLADLTLPRHLSDDPTILSRCFEQTHACSVQRDERESKGACRYCGGSFKGIFKKNCSVCGRHKDY